MDEEWIDIKEQDGPCKCGNPSCYSPEQKCENCCYEDRYVVFRDEGEQSFIEEALFVDNGWWSLTGHKFSFVTHWKIINSPNKKNKDEKKNIKFNRFEIMDI